MRTFHATLCAVLVLSGGVLSAGQGDAEPKIPSKGEKIIVRGCLHRSLLESAETRTTDDTELQSAPRYQLKGNKKVVEQLRDEHDGHLVEVTGILQSTVVPADTVQGARPGRPRIAIGVGSNKGRDRVPPSPALPVLEVLSFQGLGTACRR